MTKTEQYQKMILECMSETTLEGETYEKLSKLEGMSGKLYRKFINSLLSKNVLKNYLEIGLWKGSTAISALYNNTQKINHTLIDNFAGFGGTKEGLLKTWGEYIKDPINLIDADCFSFDPMSKNIKNIDIYFYDGEHGEIDQYKAITHYYDSMEDTFIYIVDDWYWDRVKTGTRKAIKDLNLKEKFFIEKYCPNASDTFHDVETWWNGYGIFVFEK